MNVKKEEKFIGNIKMKSVIQISLELWSVTSSFTLSCYVQNKHYQSKSHQHFFVCVKEKKHSFVSHTKFLASLTSGLLFTVPIFIWKRDLI
jgi:hypothetical protein